MPMELTLIPAPGDGGAVTFAFRPEAAGMSDDVAIVGVGIHPFGRHEGVTGLEMAAVAARRALADAGRRAGSRSTSPPAARTPAGNADTSVSVLGLTGLPFINVKNGCATGGSALDDRARDARVRRAPRSRSSSASTSTRRARSTRCPRSGGSARGTARPA